MSRIQKISGRIRRLTEAPKSSAWFIFAVTAVTLCIMTEYEQIKELVAPGLSKWQSHIVTILFSALVAAISTVAAQRRYWALHGQYERISSNAPGMVYRFTLHQDGTPEFEFVSEGCQGLYEMSPDEVRGDAMRIINLIHPEDRPSFDQTVGESARTLDLWKWEGRFCLPSGVERWIQGVSRPERRSDGATVWDGVLVDITDRKAAQIGLQRAHEELELRIEARTCELVETRDFLRSVIDAAPSMIFIKDDADRFVMVNQAFADFFGVSSEDMTSLNQVDPGGERERSADFDAPGAYVLQDQRAKFVAEEQIRDRAGAPRWFQTEQRPLIHADGTCSQILGVSTEVTERKRSEAEIWRLNDELELNLAEMHAAYDATIEAWAGFLDLRDKETEGHSRRVTEMTLRLAIKFGLSNDELVQIRRGALLHDIGKMGVPDAILLKPGALDAQEWEIMRRHTAYAHDLLETISFLAPAMDIPYCHHERWDGGGYPRGLAETDIPFAARLFAVVDVWDALGSDRPYRPAWTPERVAEHIRAGSGTHFDPQVVTAFLEMIAPEEEIQYALAA
ncbi:MAG: rpfG 1 [Capsulimonas sp.]|nr:rpfG 1 [Capsulimonas sp.]